MDEKRWLREVPLRDGDPDPRPPAEGRAVERLDSGAALTLLAAAAYGRVVFVRDGRPQIRPMGHVVDGGEVIVRTRMDAALAEAVGGARGAGVVFEADQMDLEKNVGWSVIVSGEAAPVTDPVRRDRCRRLLRTMLAGADDTVIAIRPTTVTGIRVVAVAGEPVPHAVGS